MRSFSLDPAQDSPWTPIHWGESTTSESRHPQSRHHEAITASSENRSQRRESAPHNIDRRTQWSEHYSPPTHRFSGWSMLIFTVFQDIFWRQRFVEIDFLGFHHCPGCHSSGGRNCHRMSWLPTLLRSFLCMKYIWCTPVGPWVRALPMYVKWTIFHCRFWHSSRDPRAKPRSVAAIPGRNISSEKMAGFGPFRVDLVIVVDIGRYLIVVQQLSNWSSKVWKWLHAGKLRFKFFQKKDSKCNTKVTFPVRIIF